MGRRALTLGRAIGPLPPVLGGSSLRLVSALAVVVEQPPSRSSCSGVRSLVTVCRRPCRSTADRGGAGWAGRPGHGSRVGRNGPGPMVFRTCVRYGLEVGFNNPAMTWAELE